MTRTTTDFLRRTWARIDLDALAHNVRCIRGSLPPGCRMMAVVKAEAYGHGVHGCVPEMARAGADWFGVSNMDEAVALRAAEIRQPILVLGTTPPDLAHVLAGQRITQTVFSPGYARALQEAAAHAGVMVDVHFKVDTGMARIGFDGFDTVACAEQLAQAAGGANLRAEGIFTHFSCADEDTPEADDYTRDQFSRFSAVLNELGRRGVHFALRHCCNSAATLRFPQMHMDMVRPGLILYGMAPGECCRDLLPLLPVMGLKSVVSMVKEVPPGRDVSYGRMYRTSAPTRLATVPVGYADGLRRLPPGRGTMLVRGRQAPIVGRICMDQLMLDVSGIPGVDVDDEVTLIGGDGGGRISAEDWAAWASTVNYEIVCHVGKRVPRVFVRSGETCAVEHYL